MKKVVTIGGGNGQSVILRALRHFLPQIEITAIVSVSDSGGSSGRLREQFQILPVGDILRVILALSPYTYLELRQFFYKDRFSSGPLQGHNLGNLLLTFLYQQSGSWEEAINGFSEILRIQGKVLPVTLGLVTLCAELENGQIVHGETKIDKPDYDCHLRKKKLWLEPNGNVLPAVRDAIFSADYIFIGPGDLYSSIIPNLLVSGVQEALAQTKAKLIFVPVGANREAGETCGFKTSDHVEELHKYLQRKVDMVIVQDSAVKPNLDLYKLKKWEPILPDAGDWQDGLTVLSYDLYAKDEAGLDWSKLIAPLGKILELN